MTERIRSFFEELGFFLEAFREGRKVFYSVECHECRFREDCSRAVQQKGDDGVWRVRWLDFCSEGVEER